MAFVSPCKERKERGSRWEIEALDGALEHVVREEEEVF